MGNFNIKYVHDWKNHSRNGSKEAQWIHYHFSFDLKWRHRLLIGFDFLLENIVWEGIPNATPLTHKATTTKYTEVLSVVFNVFVSIKQNHVSILFFSQSSLSHSPSVLQSKNSKSNPWFYILYPCTSFTATATILIGIQ